MVMFIGDVMYYMWYYEINKVNWVVGGYVGRCYGDS